VRNICAVLLLIGALVLFASMLLPMFSKATRDTTPVSGWRSIRRMFFFCTADGEYPYDRRGPEYALYDLSEYRAPWDGSVADEHQTQSVVSRSQSRPRNARWDSEDERLVDSGLDYINLPPKDISAISSNVIVLSYLPQDWRACWPIPFYGTEVCGHEGGEDRPWGEYVPWVRPSHFAGLPAMPVLALSDYGCRWGVYCGSKPREGSVSDGAK